VGSASILLNVTNFLQQFTYLVPLFHFAEIKLAAVLALQCKIGGGNPRLSPKGGNVEAQSNALGK
jgi:hypothetical protein